MLIGLTVSACLYNPGQRCGPAMTFVEALSACVCVDTAIAVPGGCQPCADDEVASAGTCGCAAGMNKNAANVCVTADGLGDACDTATAPCTKVAYSYCAVRGSGTAGSCTKLCTTNTDCGSAYTCATWESQPYCRTFDGIGTPCATSDECVGDARFCEIFVSHSCVVSCSLAANDCPRGAMCCDLTRYGVGYLCAPSPTCP